MNEDRHTISSNGATATVLVHGAELCSLKTAAGLELLWQAGPEWGQQHATAVACSPIAGEGSRRAISYAIAANPTR